MSFETLGLMECAIVTLNAGIVHATKKSARIEMSMRALLASHD
jgi:hypothetical protein